MAQEPPAVVLAACEWLGERYSTTWRADRDDGNGKWKISSTSGMIGWVELRPDGSLLQLRDRVMVAMPRQTTQLREWLRSSRNNDG